MSQKYTSEDYNSPVYNEMYARSIDPKTKLDFWKEEAKHLDWYDFPSKILDDSNKPFY